MFHTEYLNQIRFAELDLLRQYLPGHGYLLEIGAGTGRQGMELRKYGYRVEMLELASSNYATQRLCEITDYDGRRIPFGDATFDVVYSSNVLEHVADLPQLHSEIRRVLRPQGYAVHLVPTHYWRLWSSLSAFPAAAQRAWSLRHDLLPGARAPDAATGRAADAWLALARGLAAPFAQHRHGERGNAVTELLLFRPAWWRRNFRDNGYRIVHERPAGLFYTGSMVMASRWSMARRQKLSRVLGSACELFVVTPERAGNS
jgi:SAM-dependent methyltransferase